MKSIPKAADEFSDIRAKNLLYVDKTRMIGDILRAPRGFFILTRPRGMGKSLLLGAMAEALAGRRNHFDGLALGESDYDFRPHPVISLSLDGSGPPEAGLHAAIRLGAAQLGLNLRGGTPAAALECLVKATRKMVGSPAAVLIDDYDRFLIRDRQDLAEEARKLLAGLISRLSSMGDAIRLVFLAGVARFADDLFFRDIKPPTDLTFDAGMSAACGITAEELNLYYGDHLGMVRDHLVATNVWDPLWTASDLSRWAVDRYDGHSWDGATTVMSPISISGLIAEKRLGDFWTGGVDPSKVIKRLMAGDLAGELQKETLRITMLENQVGLDAWPTISWLLQEGWLSVQKVKAPKDAPKYYGPVAPLPSRFGQFSDAPYVKNPKRQAEILAAEAAEFARAVRSAERRRLESISLVTRISTMEVQSLIFREVIIREWRHEKTGFVPKTLDYILESLYSLDPKRVEIAFKKLVAGLRQPMYVSDRDWFHKAMYYALRALGRHLDPQDEIHEGVIDVAIDNPGRDVFLLQVRSVDHSWTPKALPMPSKGEEAWPWLPPPPKVLKDWEEPLKESEDGDLIELQRQLSLEAMMGVKVLGDCGYPMRWLALGRQVFLVGVALYGRQRVGAVVKEAFPEVYDDDDDEDGNAGGDEGGNAVDGRAN